ncbi:uncharacterized protein LOC113346688 [Papaver somniferum]|uniref:uncharacterized protein LOC113346688 n=1 Tax=Papaver somniferum TaxID=3469 RepID=UPI000E703F8A|nr:uncharacterized protein LOC113346688 [Papaver somniferum]
MISMSLLQLPISLCVSPNLNNKLKKKMMMTSLIALYLMLTQRSILLLSLLPLIVTLNLKTLKKALTEQQPSQSFIQTRGRGVKQIPVQRSVRRTEADEPSTFQTKSNLLYKYVPWCSKSSVDTQGKESWIDSWSSEHGKEPEEDRKGYHYLNIYGFYKKDTGVGGYGVILRDPCGKPVVASASVQQNGESYFYHVLDGVKDGLALALQHP